jgi:sigma-54 dependent transcriptional regulator, acetoin dehydrogenase operon transcriptional activator AcoR
MQRPSDSHPVSGHTARRSLQGDAYSGLKQSLDMIEQSHERCLAHGISPRQQPDFSTISLADLSIVRERNLRLFSHAAPVMEMLAQQIVNTESMVVVCDASGTILHSIGDDDFLAKANKVALRPGIVWSEQAKGTNAIGTALVREMPTLVHADQHYVTANHFLTCAAAPILDPKGNILGVLDVTGDHRSYHQHTMALVKMSATMIENRWLSDDYRHVIRLHFHPRAALIDTLMEGILAIDPDGRILGANRGALELLGLSGATLRRHTVASLFNTPLGDLVDHFRAPLAPPRELSAVDSQHFFVSVRFNWPTIHSNQINLTAAERFTRPDDAEPTPTNLKRAPSTLPKNLLQFNAGDKQIDAMISKVKRVLNRDIPVLILGETGTGKEVLARAIHLDSSRSDGPFVAVNCASIPETLIESELFGYEEGAFTGAKRKGAQGKILQANGGTLFLDEIGDMPFALQARLLRVLQDRQITPLGSTKSVAVDVSIICATHRNLLEMIKSYTFREDLYYRLNGLSVRIPALRDRSDLPALVESILAQERPQSTIAVSADVLSLMRRHPWPGNVRQLHNVLRMACVMADTDSLITREHLPDDFFDEIAPTVSATETVPSANAAPVPLPSIVSNTETVSAANKAPAASSLEEFEVDMIRQTLEATGGNISEASKRLGVCRNTIYRKLRWSSERDGTNPAPTKKGRAS